MADPRDTVIDTSTRAGALSAAIGESESRDREHLAELRMMGPAVRDEHLKSTHGLDTEVIDASFAAVHRLLHETVGPATPEPAPSPRANVHREQHLALYVNDGDGLRAHLTGVHGDPTDWASLEHALRWHARLHVNDVGFVTDHHYLSREPAVDANAVEQPPGGVHAAQVGQTWRVNVPPIVGKVVEVTRDSTGNFIRSMMIGADTVGAAVKFYPADDEGKYTFTLIADVEPEYEPGSMWVDADGRSWIRSVNGRWWFVGPGNDGGRVPGDSAAHTIPTRPLSLASR